MPRIALVVPTIRPESYTVFEKEWSPFIAEHNVWVIKVVDGEKPTANGEGIEEIMGKDNADLIYNFNDGVRNLGFAVAAQKLEEDDVVLTLDDDTLPDLHPKLGDTINQHLSVLRGHAPVSWIKTASEYTRGFPYGLREEAEVVLSHGVWSGVADWDAPTQLVKGNKPVTFYQGIIPKGIFYPMCGMNLAFKAKLLPYMYFAPMGPKVGVDRFADIWCGIESKKVIDEKGWAVVSGYAKVRHERASNVWANLKKEVPGLYMNENYGENDYFKMYTEKRQRWEEVVSGWLRL